MRTLGFFTVAVATLLSVSCIKEIDNGDFLKEYEAKFSNRTTISVDVTSENAGEYVALYFVNPYEEGSLVKQPALTALTPVATTLNVPNDVEQLYVLTQGNMEVYPVGDLHLSSSSVVPQSRAYDTDSDINAEIMTKVNSIYFPEKTNNVHGEDLFKCTDLKIAETESTTAFETAEVWLTFLGDGGCRMSQLYGKLWFYTYPAEKQETLTVDDCSFYGVENNEVVPVDYTADILKAQKYLFYTKEEFKSNVASYKRFKLGEFPKGVNIGFVYIGNSTEGNKGYRFTTPHLNPYVGYFTLKYKDGTPSFQITDKYLANGFICHVKVGEFEGNVLGMENRLISEGDKYDGDYNDILCLIKSNPKAIEPNDDVTIGNEDKEDKEDEIPCKTTAGLYLFEDNYPSMGDFDFNDAVIRYEIKDYYQSKNQSKQVTVETYAVGAGMVNEFGFYAPSSKTFSPLLKGLTLYQNVYPTQTFESIGTPVTQTLFGAISPCLKNQSGYYIYTTNVATKDYPCVLDIPISDPNDPDWKFLWPTETESIDDCYYFLKNENGGSRAKDWYKYPKDASLLFQR